MPTLRELKSELAQIDRELYSTWLREREEVRRRIAQMAVEFQLSPDTVAQDVAAAQRAAPQTPQVLRAPTVEVPLRAQGMAQHVAVKYRNVATGDIWTGRGPRPRWLRNALEVGAVLEDFLVDDTGARDVPRDPLRAFQDAARRARTA